MNAKLAKLLSSLCILVVSTSCTSGVQGGRIVFENDGEMPVYVTSGEPTIIEFPAKVKAGRKSPFTKCPRGYGALERRGRFIAIFAEPQLPISGKLFYVSTEQDIEYTFRIYPANEENLRDHCVRISGTLSPLEQNSPPCVMPDK